MPTTTTPTKLSPGAEHILRLLLAGAELKRYRSLVSGRVFMTLFYKGRTYWIEDESSVWWQPIKQLEAQRLIRFSDEWRTSETPTLAHAIAEATPRGVRA